MESEVDQVKIPGPERSPESAWLRAARVFVLVGGIGLVLVGLLSGVIYVLAWFLAPPVADGAPNALYAVGFALLVLATLFGVGLAVQAAFSLQNRPSRPLWLPPPPLVLMLLLAAIVLGSVAPFFGRGAGILFPIAYLFGIGLPILVVLSIAWRSLSRRGLVTRWRDTLLQLSSGAFLATSTALIIEGAVLGGIALVVILALNTRPGGADALREALLELQSASGPDRFQLQSLLASPGVILAALFVLSVVVPLIEEFLKAIGVVLLSYRHPSPRDALWWGLLGGAGFALVEGITNGSMALGEYPWGVLVLLRAGTSLIHCCTSALVGLGWQSLVARRSLREWLRRYGLAVFLHGLWNALSLGLAVVSSGQMNATPRSAAGSVVIGLLALELGAIVLLLYRLVSAGQGSDAPATLSDTLSSS